MCRALAMLACLGSLIVPEAAMAQGQSAVNQRVDGLTAFDNALREASLPPLKTQPGDAPAKLAARLQVGRRATALGLTGESARTLIRGAGPAIDALMSADGGDPAKRKRVEFAGGTLSELAAAIADDTTVVVMSREIVADKIIQISSRNVTLDLGGAVVRPGAAVQAAIDGGRSEPVIAVRNTEHVTVRGGLFQGLEGILIQDASAVTVEGATVSRPPGAGVIVGPHSTKVLVTGLNVRGALGGALVVMERSSDILLYQNTISGGASTANWHDGIVVSDRGKHDLTGSPHLYLREEPGEEGKGVYHWPPEDPIPNRHPPQRVYIVGNRISGNLGGGIYLDGAALTYVFSNVIDGNAKEGICLDNGSTANAVLGNTIAGNGRRWGQSDLDLKLDFVLAPGRMADGTAAAKVPGVSIDNAMFNIVMGNNIAGNYGGGIKMVRTGIYNLIGRNIVSDNNAGANEKFFFFGIELGGTHADSPVAELDFEPSSGNIVFQNIIAGSHHSGIQFCPQCEANDVFDNVIMRPTDFALEQTNPAGKNVFTNNFSPAPSRNANLNGSFGRVLIGGEDRPD